MIKEDVVDRIDKLSEKGKQLVVLKIKELLNNEASENRSSSMRLVSYIKGTDDFDKVNLKEYLINTLPDYMLPSELVVLDNFPKLPNGKIDVKSLSLASLKPISKPNASTLNDLSDIENRLIKIWEEVLNFNPIEINDNFFEIGGDSILSIQIIAKARKQGLEMAPNLLFEHQTIAELALFVSETNTDDTSKVELLEGDFELLPMHSWFFESHKNAPHHWNQALKITGKGLDNHILLEKSISHIVKKHDALRLSFSKVDATWKAQFLPISQLNVFEYFDFTDVYERELEEKTKTTIAKIHADLELETGGLFKCIYFDYDGFRDNCCVLLANHLVVDAVSWQIIINDFLETIKLLRDGSTEVPSSQSSTVKDWSNQLKEIASSENLNSESEYWENQMGTSKPLPIDFEAEMPILEKDIEVIDFTFDSEITNELLGQVNQSFNIKIDEILIAAFTETLCRWSDESSICLGLERHGRESDNLAIDLSNTVGWFTSFFPLTLKFDKDSDLTNKLVIVKEKLRSVPSGGIGYGVLKYILNKYEDHASPQSVFNYLGTQKSINAIDGYVCESVNYGARSAISERWYLFEINSFLKEGEVHFSWNYPKTFYSKDTIEKLIKSFREIITEIIDLSKEGNKTKYSPSDFPEVNLNQDDLDSLLNNLE